MRRESISFDFFSCVCVAALLRCCRLACLGGLFLVRFRLRLAFFGKRRKYEPCGKIQFPGTSSWDLGEGPGMII